MGVSEPKKPGSWSEGQGAPVRSARLILETDHSLRFASRNKEVDKERMHRGA